MFVYIYQKGSGANKRDELEKRDSDQFDKPQRVVRILLPEQHKQHVESNVEKRVDEDISKILKLKIQCVLKYIPKLKGGICDFFWNCHLSSLYIKLKMK